MKKILFVISFLSIIQISQAQNNSSDDPSIKMLKEFYTSYMTAIASSTPKNSVENDKKCESLKKEYCTKLLLKNIPKLTEEKDCDPIINAQDSRPDCVKNLTFKKNNKKPGAYTVSYFYFDDFSKKKEITTINLTVVNENGKYKVDGIW